MRKEETLARLAGFLPGAIGAAAVAPGFIRLMTGLMRDPRTPRHLKFLTGGLAAYIALPFDFLPDFIPLAGPGDDLIAICLVLLEFIRACPDEVLAEHWAAAFGQSEGLEDRLLEALERLKPEVGDRFGRLCDNLGNLMARFSGKSPEITELSKNS